jgi:GTP-binding protein
MVETYLRRRDTLRAVVHIVDLRHPPTVQDQQLRDWLHSHRVSIVAVATKADKVKPSRRAEHIRMVREGLAIPVDEPLFIFSALNREGRLQLWRHLELLMTPAVRRQEVPA